MDAKQRIIARATELFMKEGIKRVTMDYLAASLGMSKRTIYENYNTKDEILKDCIEKQIEVNRKIYHEIEKKSETAIHFYFSILKIGIENMKSQNPQFINDVRIFYPKIWSSILCANTEYNIKQISINLQRGINEGVFRSDVNIPIASKTILEFLNLLANSDIFPYHIYPPSELYEQTVITLVRGVSSIKGIELINKLASEYYS